MINTVKELKYVHPAYEENHAEWTFMRNAYEGGIAWEGGSYLTKYAYETQDESMYTDRIAETPYDNHCKSIVQLYNSFIFSADPIREFGKSQNMLGLEAFMEDADLEGRSMNQFMSEVNITSSIFGHCWIIIDKPKTEVVTGADEAALGVRPYLTLFDPLSVMDWKYTRQLDGTFMLTYLKVIEESTSEGLVIKEFTLTEINTYILNGNKFGLLDAVPNNVGFIPSVTSYSAKSNVRGVGISEIRDIARLNKTIYNNDSEIIQLVRLTNHPTYVLPLGTDAAAGAGAVIFVDPDIAKEHKPFILQPSASSLDGLRDANQEKVEAINRLASVGSVRNVESRTMSGIALETESRTLDAKLSSKADNLELAEEQIFEIVARWQATEWDGVITYANTFHAKDKQQDADLLTGIKMENISPEVNAEIDRQLIQLVVQDPDLLTELLETVQVQEPEQDDEPEQEDEAIDTDDTEDN